MFKKLTVFLTILTFFALIGCGDTSDQTTTILSTTSDTSSLSENHVYLPYINTDYIPFDAARDFVLSHDYFSIVYYDEELVVFIVDNTIYLVHSDSSSTSIASPISIYNTIYYYDLEQNEIYYLDTNSIKVFNLDTEDSRTLESSLTNLSKFPGGYVAFGESTRVTLFPNQTTTYDWFEKAYQFFDSEGIHYGIYDNVGGTCYVKQYLNAELLTEVTLEGVCNHTSSYGADFGVFEQTYTYDLENTIVRDRYIVIDTDGNVTYLEIPDYENLSEVNVYYRYIQFTYNQPFDELLPATRSYTLPTLEEIDFRETSIAYWNLLKVTEDYFYGYTQQNAFVQVSRTDNSVLVNVPASPEGWPQSYTSYGNEYLVFETLEYPLISGALYSMDGSVLLDNLSYYAVMSESTAVYMLQNDDSSYDIYYYDLSTHTSTKIQDAVFNLPLMIHITEEAIGIMYYKEPGELDYPNHIEIVYYDLQGNYIDTYLRYSNTRYSCFVNDSGEVLFSKP